MRVELDEPRCVAAGQCAMTAPEVFDQRDDDGVAVVLDAAPPADLHAKLRGRITLPGLRNPPGGAVSLRTGNPSHTPVTGHRQL